MSIAVKALEEQRAKLLHELEEYDRPDVRRLQQKARDARKVAADAEGRESDARQKVKAKEDDVAELNAAIHRLNGTRPIADRPQA